jgi:hypothetical protein
MIESPVHVELRNYIESSFKEQDQSFRDVLFALAYSEYCLEKKTRIRRRSGDGRGVNPNDVASVIRELRHQEEYRKFCANAETKIGVLGQKVSEAALSAIAGVVVDSLNPKLNEISLLVKQRDHKGFLGFCKSSSIHAFEIVFAVVFLKIAFEILVRIVPVLDEVNKKYLGPFYSFWGL